MAAPAKSTAKSATHQTKETDPAKYIEKKFQLLFKFYDTDGDGIISEDDFLHREKTVGFRSGMKEEEVEEYIKKMRPFYDEIVGCKREAFAKKIAELILHRPKVHEAALKTKSAALFNLLDMDKNGTLEPHEFAFLMHSWMIRDRDKVKELFELADRNKKEKLTQDEFFIFQAELLHAKSPNKISDIILEHLENMPEPPPPPKAGDKRKCECEPCQENEKKVDDLGETLNKACRLEQTPNQGDRPKIRGIPGPQTMGIRPGGPNGAGRGGPPPGWRPRGPPPPGVRAGGPPQAASSQGQRPGGPRPAASQVNGTKTSAAPPTSATAKDKPKRK